MNRIAPTQPDHRAEAIERSAWFARLAFGDAATSAALDATATRKPRGFEVLP